MKELYLSKVEKDLGEGLDRYIHIAENLLPKNENTAIYAAFIRNMLNGFGSYDEMAESVQLNVYEDIDNIVRDVNEWLESFDSKKIISKLPSLINEYRDGDFNKIVKTELEKATEAKAEIEKATEAKAEIEKEETKEEAVVEKEETKEEAGVEKEETKEEAGVENNKIPQIIKKYEDEIKNKFSEFGIDTTSDIDTLVKSFKDKDEKVINDFESFIRKAADDIINVLKDNLIIDEKFIKDICTELNIECTDKETEEFLQTVSGVLSETSSKLETTLKNGVNKMIDAIIALIRKRVEESKEEETEKPKEETETKEREMEKDTKRKTKEAKTEKNKEEKTTQQVEISADVDNTNVKKFANIVNMNMKDYTDIYASFKEDQQKYINLLRAFKAGDRTYVEEHIKLGDNKITITDYNELIAISKKITSTKRASKKETQPQQ